MQSLKKWGAALGFIVVATSSAHAAQMCVSGSGSFGSVTVTRSGTCSDFGGTISGVSNGFIVSGVSTCSFAFSPAVPASQLSVKVVDVNDFDQVGFNLNGASYTLVAGDIDTTLTPPSSPGRLSLVSNQVTGLAAQAAGEGSISFTNSAPATVSSLDVVKTGSGGVISVVCFDAPATPVPTLNQWGTIIMAMMLGLAGFGAMRRRQ